MKNASYIGFNKKRIMAKVMTVKAFPFPRFALVSILSSAMIGFYQHLLRIEFKFDSEGFPAAGATTPCRLNKS